jgi:Translation initiation factor IF-2, N-terminal region
MKLNPPPRKKMRVHELAAELGWTSRQLIAELSRRGEYVKSAMSVLEAPVVRDLRRDFAAIRGKPDRDASVAPDAYGNSAERRVDKGPDDDFAAAVARAKSRTAPKRPSSRPSHWRPVILQTLLDEVIVPRRPEHLDEPDGGYFRWEIKQAAELNVQWAEARLNGLEGDDAVVTEWIRLSGGDRPHLAADLSQAGISPDEARLHLGYGGRIDLRWPNLYQRFRYGKMNRSEVVASVRQWRRNNAAG